jgi:hypothetical protein
VLSPIISRNWFGTCLRTSAFTLLAVFAAIPLAPSGLSAQDQPVIVGRIEGDDLVVKTATGGGMEISAGTAVVASGSDVTLRSGHAILLLDTGGEISICGPAHFTLLKSAGAVTLALDYGRVHASLDAPEILTIYTPMIVATPMAISGARRDTTLGLDQNGDACILTAHGAMRIEPQFPGQGLIVPQDAVVSLVSGQIAPVHGDASSCSCDFPRAGIEQFHPSSSREISVLDHPRQSARKKSDAGAPTDLVQQPVYTVLMPPLSFDARSPAPPPDPSPETILLVREVRVRPSAVFYGHVNPGPVQAVTTQPVSPPVSIQSVPAKDDGAVHVQPGILTRLRNLLRKLIGQ